MANEIEDKIRAAHGLDFDMDKDDPDIPSEDDDMIEE